MFFVNNSASTEAFSKQSCARCSGGPVTPAEVLAAHLKTISKALLSEAAFRLLPSDPGGGVPRGPGVQARSRRLPARPGEAVDVLPEGPSELLRSRRLPLLLQPAALHQPCHQDARPRHHPGGVLHPGQQVRLFVWAFSTSTSSCCILRLLFVFSRWQKKNENISYPQESRRVLVGPSLPPGGVHVTCLRMFPVLTIKRYIFTWIVLAGWDQYSTWILNQAAFFFNFFWAHIGGDGFQRKPSVKGERGWGGRVSCWER